MERKVFAGALEHIEESLGVPIDHIIIDAKRRDAKLYVDDIVSGPFGVIARLRPFRRLGYLIMIRQAAMIGLAKAELLKYRPGKKFIGRVESVYHPILFVGDVCGAFESLEKIRARPIYGPIGEAWFSELYVDETLPKEDRLELEKTPEAPARAAFERCQGCGVPLGTGNFRWDTAQAKIIDQTTGEWIIYINVEGLNTILRELQQELGDGISRMVARHSFETYRGLMRKHPSSYLDGLSFMKLRGFGVPENEAPSRQDLEAGLTVRNPFNAPIVAGLVAAVCGDDCADFTWETTEPGVLLVRAT
ncbi:MAG: hypothetical protein AB1384_12915 [Actinomycetota bacterium]